MLISGLCKCKYMVVAVDRVQAGPSRLLCMPVQAYLLAIPV